MATALSASIHGLVPSENWDDDFEFQQRTNPPNSPIKKSYREQDPGFDPAFPSSSKRMSIASSHFTEDWDVESNANISPRRSGSLDGKATMATPTKPKVLADRKNLVSPVTLSEWADESGPLTPSQETFPSSHTTENWDDDFEDKADSPTRKARPSSPSKENSTKPRHRERSARVPRLKHDGEEAHESWDEEFGLGPPPSRRTPRKPPSGKQRQRCTPAASPEQRRKCSSEEDEIHRPHAPPQPLMYSTSDDEDDDMEFGFGDKEEDRTVTARSRRAALSRLVGTEDGADHSPTPPVPSIPAPFLSKDPIPPLPSSTSPHPFPRSPTSSVFSVPATAETRSFTSTTHLHPTTSRTSSGLGHLPPSPPIHKAREQQRERRRLRKKSRPQPNGVFELSTFNPYPYSFSDGELEDIRDGDVEEDDRIHPRAYPCPPRTPSPSRPVTSPSIPIPATPSRSSSGAGPSSVSAVPATPSSSSSNRAGTLLSRIGSVTRRGWAVRRKRGSSMTPSEIECQGVAMATSLAQAMAAEPDYQQQLTPRPRSSLSSLNHSTSRSSSRNRDQGSHANSPPTSSNWFFRSSSNNSACSPLASMENTSRSGSMTDLSLRERERQRASVYTPFLDAGANGKPSTSASTVPVTPSKLIKRKSLGFVHLRRGFGGHNGGENENITDAKRPMSMAANAGESNKPIPQPRHASYGSGRDRKRSIARPKIRDPFSTSATTDGEPHSEHPSEESKEKGKEKQESGVRSFMGNVRRLSIVGHHKRTKSSASPAHNAVEAIAASTRSDTPSGPHSRPLTPATSYPQLVQSRRPSSDTKRSVERHTRQPSLPRGMPPAATLPALPPKTPERSPQTLLPPIELQPPSPPRVEASMSEPVYQSISNAVQPPPLPSTSVPPSTPKDPSKGGKSPGKLSARSPHSPGQSASLGRSAIVAVGGNSSGNTSNSSTGNSLPRRNSLGDLKIPARISQAQVSLRRDLGMVREFASHVEQLKALQMTYDDLVNEVQALLDRHAQRHSEQVRPLPRTTSPSFFNNLSRPKSRRRSNTNPEGNGTTSSSQAAYKEIAAAFYTINSKYRISWECAELLIELGSGSSNATTAVASSSGPSPLALQNMIIDGGKKGRERAITLAGDESSKPPTPIPGATSRLGEIVSSPPTHNPPLASPPSWRASTGRHDLSHRQLSLLRDMLHHSDPTVVEESRLSILEEPPSASSLAVNRDWRWGDPMSSTVTLPSEDSAPTGVGQPPTSKKRRTGKLNLSGFRDMLRSLRRVGTIIDTSGATAAPPQASTTSLSVGSSADGHSQHRSNHSRVGPAPQQRPKSSGPDVVQGVRGRDASGVHRPTSPYGPSFGINIPKSPRRPSLASIFRIGTSKNKALVGTPPDPPSAGLPSSATESMASIPASQSLAGSSSPGEEDWDQIDSASDLDSAAKALGVKTNGLATIRGSKKLRKPNSPYLQHDPYAARSTSGSGFFSSKRSASASQTSLNHTEPPSTTTTTTATNNCPVTPRPVRLSNVQESNAEGMSPVRSPRARSGTSPSRSVSGSSSKMAAAMPLNSKNGSVRSMPPQPLSSSGSYSYPEPRLVLTPDNIKPLLENAREVQMRLDDCIAEIQILLGKREGHV